MPLKQAAKLNTSNFRVASSKNSFADFTSPECSVPLAFRSPHRDYCQRHFPVRPQKFAFVQPNSIVAVTSAG